MVLVFFLVYILHGFRLPIPHQTYPPLFFHTTAPVAFAGSFVANCRLAKNSGRPPVAPSRKTVIFCEQGYKGSALQGVVSRLACGYLMDAVWLVLMPANTSCSLF